MWVWNRDQVIRSNLIAYNQDAQVWGWFAAEDERHWPRALQQPGAANPQRPQNETAADYQAERKDGAPTALTLEKLNLTFEGNLYAVLPGQGLFGWGPKWARHKEYATLDAVRADLNLESGRVVESLPFANVHARDFRLPPDSPALKAGCYPRGEVPGARLGAPGD